MKAAVNKQMLCLTRMTSNRFELQNRMEPMTKETLPAQVVHVFANTNV